VAIGVLTNTIVKLIIALDGRGSFQCRRAGDDGRGAGAFVIWW
jgi:hypothetical protein